MSLRQGKRKKHKYNKVFGEVNISSVYIYEYICKYDGIYYEQKLLFYTYVFIIYIFIKYYIFHIYIYTLKYICKYIYAHTKIIYTIYIY